jgi:hypothetical protein
MAHAAGQRGSLHPLAPLRGARLPGAASVEIVRDAGIERPISATEHVAPGGPRARWCHLIEPRPGLRPGLELAISERMLRLAHQSSKQYR